MRNVARLVVYPLLLLIGGAAREFLVEHLDADGKVTQKIVRIWVWRKLWSQNNGEDIIYGEPFRPMPPEIQMQIGPRENW